MLHINSSQNDYMKSQQQIFGPVDVDSEKEKRDLLATHHENVDSVVSSKLTSGYNHLLAIAVRVVTRQIIDMLRVFYGDDATDEEIVESLTVTTDSNVDNKSFFKERFADIKSFFAKGASYLHDIVVFLCKRVSRYYNLLAGSLSAISRRVATFLTKHPKFTQIILKLLQVVRDRVCIAIGDTLDGEIGITKSLSNLYSLLFFGERAGEVEDFSSRDVDSHIDMLMKGDVKESSWFMNVLGNVVRSTTKLVGFEYDGLGGEKIQHRDSYHEVLQQESLVRATKSLAANGLLDITGIVLGKTAQTNANTVAAVASFTSSVAPAFGMFGMVFSGSLSMITGLATLFVTQFSQEFAVELNENIWYYNDTLQVLVIVFEIFDPEACVSVMLPSVRCRMLPMIRYVKCKVGLALNREYAHKSLRTDIQTMAPLFPHLCRGMLVDQDTRMINSVYDYLDIVKRDTAMFDDMIQITFLKKEIEKDADKAGALDALTMFDLALTAKCCDLIAFIDFLRYAVFTMVRSTAVALDITENSLFGSLFEEGLVKGAHEEQIKVATKVSTNIAKMNE